MKNQDDKLNILFCSRLVLEKGVDILLDVIEQSLADPFLTDKIIWHIASDGDSSYEVENISLKSKGKVIYYGKISQLELAELMRASDLLFMPSRFLETFWLTALEALATWIAVCGIKKWWLDEFIPLELSIEEKNPVETTLSLLKRCLKEEISLTPIWVESFHRNYWKKRFESIFPPHTSLFLLHDYKHRIWGAEAYIDSLCEYLPDHSYALKRCSYNALTTPLKRRCMFILSIFAFWRGNRVYKELLESKPDNIWMHSVLRYFGYWWVRAVKQYSEGREVGIFLSHHDVGFIAPFPQDIYHENEIPKSRRLWDFIDHVSWIWKMVSIFKWMYIMAMRSVFPKNLKHIIFSSFLEKHIIDSFPWSTVYVLPHTFDETIFHP